MKKLMYLLVWLNLIVFSIITYISYSNQIPYNVLKDKEKIQIVKPDDMESDELVKVLYNFFKNNNTDIMYRTIENPSKLKPTYIFYKTSNTEEFTNISIENHSTLINENEKLATDTKGENDSYQIIGSSLRQNVVIYNFLKLSDKNLDVNIYYIPKLNSDNIITKLQQNGFEVSKINDNIVTFEEEPVFNFIQDILLVFLFCSVLFYMFSRTKDIVIKKMNGYGNINILFEELKNNIFKFVLILIACQIIVIIFTYINYPYAVMNYIKYSFNRDIVILLGIIIIFVINTFYIIMQKTYLSIKGTSKDFVVSTIATVSKISAVIFLIFSLTGSAIAITSQQGILNSLESINNKISKYFSFTTNVSNVDIEANYSDINKRSEEFCKAMAEKYETIICKKVITIGGLPVLEVNKNYFEINPIYTIDGTKITASNSVNKAFLPISLTSDEISKNYFIERFNYEKIKEEDIIKYDSNTNLIYSYNSDDEMDKDGSINKAVIICKDSEELIDFSAYTLLSSSDIMLKANTEDPYSEIFPYLKQFGLENIILEANFVTDMFNDELENVKIRLYTFVSISIIYIILLIILLVFETEVYFQNNKKKIAIKILNGYGNKTYLDALITRAISLIVYIGISIGFGFSAIVALAVALLDVIIFLAIMKKTLKNKITTVLKGDE